MKGQTSVGVGELLWRFAGSGYGDLQMAVMVICRWRLWRFVVAWADSMRRSLGRQRMELRWLLWWLEIFSSPIIETETSPLCFLP